MRSTTQGRKPGKEQRVSPTVPSHRNRLLSSMARGRGRGARRSVGCGRGNGLRIQSDSGCIKIAYRHRHAQQREQIFFVSGRGGGERGGDGTQPRGTRPASEGCAQRRTQTYLMEASASGSMAAQPTWRETGGGAATCFTAGRADRHMAGWRRRRGRRSKGRSRIVDKD